MDPCYAETYYNRGNIYQDKGNLGQAIHDYNKTIEIDPKLAGAYYSRAVAYFGTQEYAKFWEDVHRVETMGYEIRAEFMEALKKASGRQDSLR